MYSDGTRDGIQQWRCSVTQLARVRARQARYRQTGLCRYCGTDGGPRGLRGDTGVCWVCYDRYLVANEQRDRKASMEARSARLDELLKGPYDV